MLKTCKRDTNGFLGYTRTLFLDDDVCTTGHQLGYVRQGSSQAASFSYKMAAGTISCNVSHCRTNISPATILICLYRGVAHFDTQYTRMDATGEEKTTAHHEGLKIEFHTVLSQTSVHLVLL